MQFMMWLFYDLFLSEIIICVIKHFVSCYFGPPTSEEGQLLVSGEWMRTSLVSSLEDQACPGKVWLAKMTD